LVYDKKNYSISEDTNDKDINLDFAIELVKPKDREALDSNIIKKINDSIIIKTGPYGAYISYKNNGKFHNIKIFNKNPKEITESECMELITKKFKKK
jgi:topoisomerase IA-like protein